MQYNFSETLISQHFQKSGDEMSDKKENTLIGSDGVHISISLRDRDFIMSGHHCHNCYELLYVESGACRFLTDENLYDLHAGDFVLIPPLVLHYCRYLFGACKRSIIFFRKDDITPAILQFLPRGEWFLSETRIFQVPMAHRDQIVSCLNQMGTEEKINDPRSGLLRRNYLQSLLLLCSRVCIFLSDPPADIHTTDQQVLQAARYISENYMHPVTTADVAAAVGFSPNYLSRKFRRAAGIGLHEYLVFIRLHHAALELVATEDSITTVAFRCGFSDSNYFKDAFKKKYGITPRGYRKAQ